MCDGYALDFKIQKPKSSLQNLQLLKMKQNTLEDKLQLLFSPGQDQPQSQQEQKRERAISYRGSDVAQRQDESNKRTSMIQLRQTTGEQSQQQPEQQQLGAARQHISHRRGGSSEVSSLGISEADPFQELNDQLKAQETQLQQQQKAYAAITTESLRIPFPHKHNQQQQYFQSNSVGQVNSSHQFVQSLSQSQSQQQQPQQQQSGRYSQIDPSTRGVYGLITHSADKNRKSPQPYLECSKSIELLENKLDGMNTRGNKLDQIRLISQHVISSIDAKETAAQKKMTQDHAEDGVQEDSKLIINKENHKKKELFNVYDSSEVAITELYNKRQRELRSSLEAQPNGSWKKYINASAESSDNKKTKKKWERDHSNSKGLFNGGGMLAQQEDKQYLQENPIGKTNEAENKGQYTRDTKTRTKLEKAKSTTDITKETKIKGKILAFGNQDKQGNQQNTNALEQLRQQAQIPTYFKTTLSAQNKLKQKPSSSSLANQRKGNINNEKSENYKNYNEIHGGSQKEQQRCDSSNKAAQRKTEEDNDNGNHSVFLGKIQQDNVENISQISQPQLRKPLLPQRKQIDKKGISIHERLFNDAKKAQILRAPSSKDNQNNNHNSNGMMSKPNRDESKKDKNLQPQQQQQQQRLFSLQNIQDATDYDFQQQKENIQILKPAYFELKSHCKGKVQYPSAVSRPPRLEESTHEKNNRKDFNAIECNNRQFGNDLRYHQPEHEQKHQNSDRKVTASSIPSVANENLIKPYPIPPLPPLSYQPIKQQQLQYQQHSQCINVSSCICGICTSTHQLFSYLDGDNDGIINVESLSLSGIQTELLLLISDLLLRVESMHQNVNFDMFYQLTSYQLRTRIAQHYQDNQVSMLHERYPQSQNNPSQVFATFQPSYQ